VDRPCDRGLPAKPRSFVCLSTLPFSLLSHIKPSPHHFFSPTLFSNSIPFYLCLFFFNRLCSPSFPETVLGPSNLFFAACNLLFYLFLFRFRLHTKLFVRTSVAVDNNKILLPFLLVAPLTRLRLFPTGPPPFFPRPIPVCVHHLPLFISLLLGLRTLFCSFFLCNFLMVPTSTLLKLCKFQSRYFSAARLFSVFGLWAFPSIGFCSPDRSRISFVLPPLFPSTNFPRCPLFVLKSI